MTDHKKEIDTYTVMAAAKLANLDAASSVKVIALLREIERLALDRLDSAAIGRSALALVAVHRRIDDLCVSRPTLVKLLCDIENRVDQIFTLLGQGRT